MSKVLIVFGTTDGHTRKIAQAMRQELQTRGVQADVVDAGEASPAADPPEGYDAVVVAASVHAGGYQRAVVKWVKRHAPILSRKPTAFVSVCLGVLEHKPETNLALGKIRSEFLEKTGWKPTVTKVVAGAIPYTRYGFFKKWVMKRIAAKAGGGIDTSVDYEYTDWADLKNFVGEMTRKQGLA